MSPWLSTGRRHFQARQLGVQVLDIAFGRKPHFALDEVPGRFRAYVYRRVQIYPGFIQRGFYSYIYIYTGLVPGSPGLRAYRVYRVMLSV